MTATPRPIQMRSFTSSTSRAAFNFGDLTSRLNPFGRRRVRTSDGTTTPQQQEAGDSSTTTTTTSPEDQATPGGGGESGSPPQQSLAKRITDAGRRALLGNRREREMERIRGGMTPQEARLVEEDRRRALALAAVDASGESLLKEGERDGSSSGEGGTGLGNDDRSKRLIDRMISRQQARSERKRWGGLRAKEPEHKYSTTDFKISPRKLQLLADQINGKPIDHAILQMQFSSKRAASRIKSMLVLARDHAIATKGMDRKRILVSEAWVGKAVKQTKMIEWKGRMHTGVITHQWSHMDVVLRMGKTKEEIEGEKVKKWNRKVGRLTNAKPAETHAPVGWGY